MAGQSTVASFASLHIPQMGETATSRKCPNHTLFFHARHSFVFIAVLDNRDPILHAGYKRPTSGKSPHDRLSIGRFHLRHQPGGLNAHRCYARK